MRRVLVVDDEENIRLVLRTLLKKHGYEVEVADGGEAALAALDLFDPDVILTDVRMPRMGGLDLLGALKAKQHPATVIVMSAYGNVDLAIEAMKAGAYDYVGKPFKPDEVVLALRKAEERESLRRENRALKEQIQKDNQFESILAKSQRDARHLQDHLEDRRLQDHGAHHGRERHGQGARRARHPRASRRARPRPSSPSTAARSPRTCSRASCSATRRAPSPTPAPTAAASSRRPTAARCSSTRSASCPLNLQVKLLRVLQEEHIRRLGDTKDVKVDVRIIAATHRDLTADVKAGRFREDLFYRINVLAIHIPPLRSRREDVSLLIDHFVTRNNARLGTSIRGLSPEARKLLLEYAWPGNVRELENTIERAMVLAESDVLQTGDLPERIREALDPVQVHLASGELSVKKTTAAIEEILIRRALQKTKGNRTRAADLLEISHRALLYKIKDYKITDL